MLSKLLIDKTKPGSKTIRLWDGRGMYLEISPKGGKWWRLKYWFGGKERRMSMGVYPDVSLADAREKRGKLARWPIQPSRDGLPHRRSSLRFSFQFAFLASHANQRTRRKQQGFDSPRL